MFGGSDPDEPEERASGFCGDVRVFKIVLSVCLIIKRAIRTIRAGC